MYTSFGLMPKKMNAKVCGVGLSGREARENPAGIQGNLRKQKVSKP
jgi:hypothetical protein